MKITLKQPWLRNKDQVKRILIKNLAEFKERSLETFYIPSKTVELFLGRSMGTTNWWFVGT